MDDDNVESQHTCTICMRLLYEPMTLECSHNYCKLCLLQLLRSTTNTKQCPMCRLELNDFDMDTASVNKVLRKEVREKYPEIYKARRTEHREDMEDEKNKFIKKLIVGNDCETHKKTKDQEWKKWTFYVIMEDEADNIGEFVEKIEVNLHPTFQPSKLTFLKPPFEIVRTGWGTFEINFTVYFTEQTKKKDLLILVGIYRLKMVEGKELLI